MYKLIVIFQSDVDNVYTEEIEIATNDYMKNEKTLRMIDRWVNIICKQTIDSSYIYNINFKIDLINLYLKHMNNHGKTNCDRTFSFKIIEI